MSSKIRAVLETDSLRQSAMASPLSARLSLGLHAYAQHAQSSARRAAVPQPLVWRRPVVLRSALLSRRRPSPVQAVAAAASASSQSPLGGAGDTLTAEEKAHLATVAAKVASCGTRLQRAAWIGFWTQLVLSVVSAVIIVFSIVFKGVTKVRERQTASPRPSRPVASGVCPRGRTLLS